MQSGKFLPTFQRNVFLSPSTLIRNYLQDFRVQQYILQQTSILGNAIKPTTPYFQFHSCAFSATTVSHWYKAAILSTWTLRYWITHSPLKAIHDFRPSQRYSWIFGSSGISTPRQIPGDSNPQPTWNTQIPAEDFQRLFCSSLIQPVLVLRPFGLRLFALTPLTNLHFLICAISFSV